MESAIILETTIENNVWEIRSCGDLLVTYFPLSDSIKVQRLMPFTLLTQILLFIRSKQLNDANKKESV